ncbi:glycoside hydrolase family 125 protein, partial [Helcococcus ovis]|uniref:glycoside hydrolase family 125 protein n=1 Tax=Helcococcus ovis TaxID=72026 RepID=UPI001ADC59E5
VNSSLKNYSDYLLKTPGYSTYEYSISKMLPILIYIDIICEIYAYEVDGLGNQLFMDDANVPSLLSLPYLGYISKNDDIYLNTRK